MKKIIICVLIFSLQTLVVLAGNVPEPVKKAFKEKFPGVENVTWSKEHATEYEANFTFGGTKMSANFSADGKWLETETEIAVADLPENIVAAVKKKFPDESITGADEISSAKKGTTYEVDLKSEKRKHEAVFKEDGIFVK